MVMAGSSATASLVGIFTLATDGSDLSMMTSWQKAAVVKMALV